MSKSQRIADIFYNSLKEPTSPNFTPEVFQQPQNRTNYVEMPPIDIMGEPSKKSQDKKQSPSKKQAIPSKTPVVKQKGKETPKEQGDKSLKDIMNLANYMTGNNTQSSIPDHGEQRETPYISKYAHKQISSQTEQEVRAAEEAKRTMASASDNNPYLWMGLSSLAAGAIGGDIASGALVGSQSISTALDAQRAKDLAALKASKGEGSLSKADTINVVGPDGNPMVVTAQKAAEEGLQPYYEDKFHLQDKMTLKEHEAMLDEKFKKGEIKDALSLKKSFDSHHVTKKTNGMVMAYNDIMQNMKGTPHGGKDMAIIIDTMKLLDPTSVVRESEQETVMKRTGMIPQKLWNEFLRLKGDTSATLTTTARSNIKDMINNKLQSQLASQKYITNSYNNMAKQYNINTSNITDLAKPTQAPVVQSEEVSVPSGRLKSGEIKGVINGQEVAVPKNMMQRFIKDGGEIVNE